MEGGKRRRSEHSSVGLTVSYASRSTSRELSRPSQRRDVALRSTADSQSPACLPIVSLAPNHPILAELLNAYRVAVQ